MEKKYGSKAGLLDTYVFFYVVAALWVLCGIMLLITRSAEELLSKRLPQFYDYDPTKHVRRADYVEQEIAITRDAMSISTRASRRIYYVILLVFIISVVVFQVAVPFARPGLNSWALRPVDLPLTYIIATAWAFFYWVLIIGNAAWLWFASIFHLMGLIRRISRDEAIVVAPLKIHVRAQLKAFAGFGWFVSLPFTVLGMMLSSLSIKLFRGDTWVLFAVFPLLLAHFVILAVAIISVRRAIKRSRDRYVDASTKFVDTLFRRVRSRLDPEGKGFPGSERDLLELLVWERIHDRAEAMSMLSFDIRTAMGMAGVFGLNLLIAWRQIQEIEPVLHFLR